MKKYQIEIKWGVIFFALMVLWTYFEKLLGWHNENIDKQALYTNFFGIIAIVVYFLAIRDKKQTIFHGKMSWKQGFVSGIILSVVIALLSPLHQVIAHKLISPDFFNNIIEYNVDAERMTREDAEAFFNLNSYIVQGISNALTMGVITSALVALILKRK